MSETTSRNVRWGMGKVEFRPLIPEIRQSLADGWPKKAIFEKLQEQGKVNMGYVSFCGFVRKFITEAMSEVPPKKTRRRKPKAPEVAALVSSENALALHATPSATQANSNLAVQNVECAPALPTPAASTMSTNLFTGSNAVSTGENHA